MERSKADKIASVVNELKSVENGKHNLIHTTFYRSRHYGLNIEEIGQALTLKKERLEIELVNLT